MKSSIYNICIQTDGCNSIIFNALKGTSILVDSEMKTAIESNSLEMICPEDLFTLVDSGFLVEDDLDERNVYAFEHNQNKYSTDISSFLVLPTLSCNLSCPYCYEDSLNISRSRSMDRNIAENVTNFIKNQVMENHSRSVVLGLYGGEPLLESDLCIQIAESISKWTMSRGLNYFSALTTNGTMLSQETFDKLRPFISSVHFTLDGPEEEHNKMRFYKGGRGTYSDLMKAISLAGESNIHLTVRIHIGDRTGQGDFAKVLGDLEAIGLRGRPRTYLYFMPIEPKDECFNTSSKKSLRRKLKNIELLPCIWNMARELGWGESLHVDAGQEHSLLPFSRLPCGFLKNGCYVIDPSARLYSCPSVAGIERYSVGSISQDGTAIWLPSYYDAITASPTDATACKDCSHLPLCNGGCPVRPSSAQEPDGCHLKEFYNKKILTHLAHKYPTLIWGT
ncbi:MAG: molybdenum cofactor biosynthesis protein A [Methanosaeta sp. PtaU1.Bin112]|nr:MAG: molybdenum cofactor biosynthesis protein A [Methanosaeta sp. PtaU1.Bin112]